MDLETVQAVVAKEKMVDGVQESAEALTPLVHDVEFVVFEG